MRSPTLATWLYGPIGVGVRGGVVVWTVGMRACSCRGEHSPRRASVECWRDRLARRVTGTDRIVGLFSQISSGRGKSLSRHTGAASPEVVRQRHAGRMVGAVA